MADQLQAALRRVGIRQALEARTRGVRVVHWPLQVGDAGDVEARLAQPRQVRLGIVHPERQDVQPIVAVEEPAQLVVEQRRIEDRQQLDVAVAQEGAAVARPERLNGQVGPPAAALPRDGGEREAQRLVRRRERRQLPRADADVVEGERRGRHGFSYFGSSHSAGSPAASSYQRATSGCARTASQ